MKRVHIRVFGDVQGVGYRFNVIEETRNLNLLGWVRNTPSGGVEIVAEGEKTSLEKLIEWCDEGPTFSRVENVDVEWQKYTGEFSTFDVKY